MARLRDRVSGTAETRGELVFYKLDRSAEITCARCAGRSTTGGLRCWPRTGPAVVQGMLPGDASMLHLQCVSGIGGVGSA